MWLFRRSIGNKKEIAFKKEVVSFFVIICRKLFRKIQQKNIDERIKINYNVKQRKEVKK